MSQSSSDKVHLAKDHHRQSSPNGKRRPTQSQYMRLGRARPLLESEIPGGIRSRVLAHDLLSTARETFAKRVMQIKRMGMMPGRGMVTTFMMTMMQVMLRR